MTITSKKQWTIIGNLGTIDYMGNDKYISQFWDEATTHVFGTKDLNVWLKRIEAHSDAAVGITTAEWNS